MKFLEDFLTPEVKKTIVFFVVVNLLLYLFISTFYKKVEFNKNNYLYNTHHYISDNRILEQKFNLVNSLGQYDAQWFLKIAEKGYPEVKRIRNSEINTAQMHSLLFNFFPTYPTLLSIVNVPVRNIELAAFITSNLLFFINIGVLLYVIAKIYTPKIAQKTVILLFLFPFSIFFRSYFSESLFLFFLSLYVYFLINNQNLKSSLFLGLLNITRGSGVLLYLPHMFFLFKGYREKKVSLVKFIGSTALAFSPPGLWSIYNYVKTGDFLFFVHIRAQWIDTTNIFSTFSNNLRSILAIEYQQFHYFHSSQVDITLIFIAFIILSASFSNINKKLWLISLCLFLSPLFFNTTMSYGRYVSISFPLFLYLAIILKGKWFMFLAGAFALGLFIVSLYFVNWHWVG